MLIFARSLLVFTAAAFASSSFNTVTVTPWCSDAFRVQVIPPGGKRSGAFASPEKAFAALTTASTAPANSGKCTPGAPTVLGGSTVKATSGNLVVQLNADGTEISFSRADTGAALVTAAITAFAPSSTPGFHRAQLTTTPANPAERIFGLGQGNWTGGDACASGSERIVPLERAGQTLRLLQRKFHVTNPLGLFHRGVWTPLEFAG
jgi:hypothetical protein